MEGVGRLVGTRNSSDIASIVFTPAATISHVVYFAMMTTETATKGENGLFCIRFFVKEMKAKVLGRSCKPERGWLSGAKRKNRNKEYSIDQASEEDGDTEFGDQAMAVTREAMWKDARGRQDASDWE